MGTQMSIHKVELATNSVVRGKYVYMQMIAGDKSFRDTKSRVMDVDSLTSYCRAVALILMSSLIE